MSLLVTGSIGIDTVHTQSASVERVLGGSCSYFAAAASFHTPVRVVAAVGGDWPAAHREVLSGFDNVNLAGLDERSSSKTFAWGGRYHEHMNGRDTLFTELGVLEEPPPPVPGEFRDSRFVFLANTHPQVQLDLLAQCEQPTLSVADSMDLWINVARDDLMRLLAAIDGIIINDSEAEQLTEQPNAISAAREILDMGPSFVIVKKGEHGAVLVHADGLAVVPAFPADASQVVDPTGAGDSFAGGLMGYLAANNASDFGSIQTALVHGTIMASFTLESFSLDRLASLTSKELDQRLTDFQRMARIG